jgi:thioesterase domain-containing protein
MRKTSTMAAACLRDNLLCVLAYEVAQQLSRAGERTSLLALLDGNFVETPVDILNVVDDKALEGEIRQWQEEYILQEAIAC